MIFSGCFTDKRAVVTELYSLGRKKEELQLIRNVNFQLKALEFYSITFKLFSKAKLNCLLIEW